MGAVLIVSGPDDVHAQRVAQELRVEGAGVQFFDVRSLGRTSTLSYRLDAKGATMMTQGHSEPIVFSDVDSVWLRRPSIPFLPATISDAGDRRFARTEWRELIDGVFNSMRAHFVNPFLAQFGAVKPRQLEAAQRVGLRIPDTLITSDPNEAKSFVDSYERVVHKAMSPHPNQLLETRRWTEQDRRRLSTLCLAPTIFQEEIRGRADVRITVAGDRMFSARMESTNGHDRVDSRLDLDAHCERYDLPTKLENALQALMRDLELVFGTIDLRIDDDGQHFFLEVNPQGQFLYIEILTGMPIAAAVAKLLAGAPGVEPASRTVHPDRPS